MFDASRTSDIRNKDVFPSVLAHSHNYSSLMTKFYLFPPKLLNKMTATSIALPGQYLFSEPENNEELVLDNRTFLSVAQKYSVSLEGESKADQK